MWYKKNPQTLHNVFKNVWLLVFFQAVAPFCSRGPGRTPKSPYQQKGLAVNENNHLYFFSSESFLNWFHWWQLVLSVNSFMLLLEFIKWQWLFWCEYAHLVVCSLTQQAFFSNGRICWWLLRNNRTSGSTVNNMLIFMS